MAAPRGTVTEFGNFDYTTATVKLFIKDVLNGMEITYFNAKTNDTKTYAAGNLGPGSSVSTFELKSGEFITSVSGYYKNYDSENCISQVTFTNNMGKKYGPYGPGGEADNPFDVKIVNTKIMGFFSLYDHYVNYIGTGIPLN